MILLTLIRDHLFALALAASLGLHAAAVWWGFVHKDDHEAAALPLRRAVTTVSLMRTTVKPEERVEQLRRSEPLPQLPPERKLDSPVKRLAAELPLPKPESPVLPPKQLAKLPPPLPDEEPVREELEEPPPPEPKRPPRAKPVVLPDLTAAVAERVQEQSFATTGVETAPAVAASNPPPPFPSAYRNQLRESMRVLVSIDAAGRVLDCQVIDSSGVGAVDADYAAFIRQHWRFIPARRAGESVDGQCAVRLNLHKR